MGQRTPTYGLCGWEGQQHVCPRAVAVKCRRLHKVCQQCSIWGSLALVLFRLLLLASTPCVTGAFSCAVSCTVCWCSEQQLGVLPVNLQQSVETAGIIFVHVASNTQQVWKVWRHDSRFQPHLHSLRWCTSHHTAHHTAPHNNHK